MATQPTTLPEWASDNINDPVTGAANKIEPTASFKLSGVNRNEAIIRPYLNYELDNLSDWTAYFNFSILSGNASTSGGAIIVSIPAAFQDGVDYQVQATAKVSGLGNIWVVNTDATQFTVHSDVDGSIDWTLINR